MNHSAISVSEIKALKEEANKQFKAGQYSQAESQYYDILMKIDDSDTREDIVNEKKNNLLKSCCCAKKTKQKNSSDEDGYSYNKKDR